MILTLCGSARFEKHYHAANKLLGLSGHICFALMTYPSIEGQKSWYTEDEKWGLDLAHFAKIEESDGVVMLNVDGYLGESSLRELRWARMREKLIFWCYNDNRMILKPLNPFQVPEAYVRGLMNLDGGEWQELTNMVKGN